jgi:hypothetical protein
MKRLLVLLFAAMLTICQGCYQAPRPTLTPLEIQSMQTRNYESAKKVVFPSVISVFQDLGYTVTNADLETGLISAESAAQSDATSRLFGYTKVTQTKATGFVETIHRDTRVRLNFVEVSQTSSGYGQNDRHDTPILNAALYQNAFEKIENAIFIRSSH